MDSVYSNAGTISSKNAKGERRVLLHALWHGIGVALVLSVASLPLWNGQTFLISSQIFPLVSLTLVAYLATSWANWRMLHFPVWHGERVILANLGLAFLIVLGVLALGQFYVSRSFILMAFIATLCWQLLGLRLRDKSRIRLAVVPGDLAEELLRLRNAQWTVLAQPVGPVAAAGVVLDRETARTPAWTRFLADSALRGVPAYDAASVYESMTGRVLLSHSDDDLAEQCAIPPLYLAVKQVADIVLAAVTLVIILPFIALTALLIRLDSPGPVFFWQERVGEAGRIFRMVKFRTMHIHNGQTSAQFAVAESHRITRVGRWLRRFRLDELPQIWHVLRGDMSLIGPRPEQVPFAEVFTREIPLYPCRHLVMPGISGWAQVNHGYASGHEETRTKLAYDLYYVKHCSFWLDALIALRTLRTVITGHGAR